MRQLLFLLGFISLPPVVLAGTLEYGYGLGVAKDDFSWNIASDMSGTQTPNIMSELTWSDLYSIEFKFFIDYFSVTRLYFGFDAGINYVVAGDNQDSDYLGDYRTEEFSRSNNDSGSGDGKQINFRLGYRFGGLPQFKSVTHAIIPTIGYQFHDRKRRMKDGIQTIATPDLTPPLGPISGLDSSYEYTMDGPTIGIKYIYDNGNKTRIAFDYNRHFPTYKAKANWNLREDFAHPVSFTQRADGVGDLFTIDFITKPTPETVMNLEINYFVWDIEPGEDVTNYTNGTTIRTRLNNVSIESTSIFFYYTYLYR